MIRYDVMLYGITMLVKGVNASNTADLGTRFLTAMKKMKRDKKYGEGMQGCANQHPADGNGTLSM